MPSCFLHIPKSGGSSVVAAIEHALTPSALAPQRLDRSAFCDFDHFELLRPEARAHIVIDRDEIRSLASYPVVAGHFSLDTLLQVAPATSIFTVLREPRARLLSLYLYWRTPGISDFWHPYCAPDLAQRPLVEFLSNRRLATSIDNQICRMLLPGDPRMPRSSFVAAADINAIAADAIERLEQLGFVGILELGEQMWHGLALMLDTVLQPKKVNVASEHFDITAPRCAEKLFTVDAFEPLERRTAADMLVFRHMLAHAVPDVDKCERLVERSFAQQLVLLGDLVGSSAAHAAELTTYVAELQAERSDENNAERELADAQIRIERHDVAPLALQAELVQQKRDADRLRLCLAAIERSISWQLTRPLRASKSLTRRLFSHSSFHSYLNSLFSGRFVGRIWWAALVYTSAVATIDAVLTNHVILIPCLAAGPCLAALTGQWMRAAATGAWALALGLVLGVPDEIWGTSLQLRYLLIVAGASLLSMPAAAILQRRRRGLKLG